jgi:hypothetical protein
MEPSSVVVQRPPKPTFAIDTVSVNSPTSMCLGSGVATVRLHATGKGPWTAMYREQVGRILRGKKKTLNKKKINKSIPQ